MSEGDARHEEERRGRGDARGSIQTLKQCDRKQKAQLKTRKPRLEALREGLFESTRRHMRGDRQKSGARAGEEVLRESRPRERGRRRVARGDDARESSRGRNAPLKTVERTRDV